MIAAKEKYNNPPNKNTKTTEKEDAKNLPKRKVLLGKKIEKLTLDDFNRR
jgi:hypothetical protein